VNPSRMAVAAAFAAIYLLWGGTFLAIRYVVAEVPPLLTIAIRCVGGAALLFAWQGLRGGRPTGTAAQWLTALAAGTFLFLGCHALLAWAEQRVSSGEAALLMTAIPLWLVLLSAARERQVPPLRVLAGLGLGVVGVALLAGGCATMDTSKNWVDIKDPSELRTLFSDKTFSGKGQYDVNVAWTSYNRSDGHGIFVSHDSKRYPYTWKVTGADQVCFQTERDTRCNRYQRHGTHAAAYRSLNLKTNQFNEFTIKDGVPKF